MATVTKRTKKRSGDIDVATDRSGAAPQLTSTAGEGVNETEGVCARRANTSDRAGVTPAENDKHVAQPGRKHKASGGDYLVDGEITNAPTGKPQRKAAIRSVPPEDSLPPSDCTTAGDGGDEGSCDAEISVVPAICQQLAELGRRRASTIKSRIAIDNQTAALVAQEMGYRAALDEKERHALFAQARKTMKAIYKGDELDADGKRVAEVCGVIVFAAMDSSSALDHHIDGIEKEMTRLAKSLPVADWCKSVRGFGYKSLAVIIGETGDLSLYANPAKVWKRLGLAPIKGKMPSTWRSKGGLSAEEWTQIGYSPRRRSVVYAMIGENIVKSNNGEYRQRYDDTKAAFQLKNPDESKKHCHMHGMLLASKRLIRDLWVQWHKAA